MSSPATIDTTPNATEPVFTEGDTFRFAYAFKFASGDPRPITGWVLSGSIRRVGASGDPDAAFDFAEARDDAAGTGFVNVAGFEDLTPGTYSWAMEREIPAADPVPEDDKTFARGTIKIRKRLP